MTATTRFTISLVPTTTTKTKSNSNSNNNPYNNRTINEKILRGPDKVNPLPSPVGVKQEVHGNR